MKRILAVLLFISLMSFLTACGGEEAEVTETESGHTVLTQRMEGEVIELSERLFIAQTNDIYLNRADYLGKTIRYEGFFTSHVDEGSGREYSFVVRNGPGCCGDDGQAGFELLLSDPWPEENDWCIVEGVLEEYEEDGYGYLRITVSSLTVTDSRGAEFVAT